MEADRERGDVPRQSEARGSVAAVQVQQSVSFALESFLREQGSEQQSVVVLSNSAGSTVSRHQTKNFLNSVPVAVTT